MASRLTHLMPPSALLQASFRPGIPHLIIRASSQPRPQLPRQPLLRTFTHSSPRLTKQTPLKKPTLKPLPYSPTASHRKPPKPNNLPSDLDAIKKARKIPQIGILLAGMVAGIYILPFAYSLFAPKETQPTTTPSPSSECCSSHPVTGRPAGLDISRAPDATPRERRDAAEEFDMGLNYPEWLMGIKNLRKTLGVEARGDVLELAVGTGRNLKHYDWSGVVSGEAGEDDGLRSFTGVDISPDMVGVARDRLRDAVPGLARVMRKRRAETLPERGLAVEVLDGRARLFVGDAEGELPRPLGGEGGKYDTVVQTFGLCSVAEPVKLLESAAGVVKPDTGRIILLEHGRGTSGWFNKWFVDGSAQEHFDKFGCWWNRDIETAVREAEKKVPGLEVVALKRPGFMQFGTLFLIELKVNSKKIPAAKAVDAGEAVEVGNGKVEGDEFGTTKPSSEEPKRRGGWWPGSK
ncbi:S-adenosyl-L-methionine-dependent methyltransferase [Cercophora newfieldiana]|uniref:S-adenosyl-L-methionine-dependent methyltransferase n=1 Tax=Cercophora newfieldiana TaxID=92897 RepID=A0AA40CKM5_9PEZI|nr:S-adenosyl-L-methionine-dependent methyltransferase [Cercophora newfieldiana]